MRTIILKSLKFFVTLYMKNKLGKINPQVVNRRLNEFLDIYDALKNLFDDVVAMKDTFNRVEKEQKAEKKIKRRS